jgi:hypothetical protein
MENTNPPDEIAQAVIKAFSLEDLGAGNHFSSDGTQLLIDSIWIIELPFYFGADIYIAGVNQIKWIPLLDQEGSRAINIYKGLLLAAPYTKFDFYGADPYRVIDLEWPDEMVNGLQSLNMLPYIRQANGENQEYKVHTYWSGGGEGHALYNIMFQSPVQTLFHDTILHTIKSMAALYNDREINQIIERGRNIFRSFT